MMRTFRLTPAGGAFAPEAAAGAGPSSRTTLFRPVRLKLGRSLTLPWCCLALASVAAASEPAPVPATTNLTLPEVVTIALRDNATLRSQREKWAAMAEQTAQAGTLPNPMLTYGGMDMASGGTWPDTNEKRIMVEQEFPWFGKRGLREDIARKNAETMQGELDTMTRDVVMMVKEGYYELYAVQRVMVTTRQDEAVLQRMAKIAEAMYAAGERSQQDVLKAKSEITMLKQRLLDLEAQENALTARLNTLLNRRADAAFGLAVTPPPTNLVIASETLFALAATHRPEVHVAQAEVERYALERTLMARESQPDYRLGLEYRNISDSDNMVMFTVGIDLPLWRSKYRAGVREAEKMQASREAAREAAERQSAFDVQDAQFKLLTAQRTLALYRDELIPQATARFNASESGYRTGELDFLDLLESQRFLLGARVMAAMAEGTIGMQFARLERAVGTDLQAGLKREGTSK